MLHTVDRFAFFRTWSKNNVSAAAVDTCINTPLRGFERQFPMYLRSSQLKLNVRAVAADPEQRKRRNGALQSLTSATKERLVLRLNGALLTCRGCSIKYGFVT